MLEQIEKRDTRSQKDIFKTNICVKIPLIWLIKKGEILPLKVWSSRKESKRSLPSHRANNLTTKPARGSHFKAALLSSCSWYFLNSDFVYSPNSGVSKCINIHSHILPALLTSNLLFNDFITKTMFTIDKSANAIGSSEILNFDL